MINYAQAGLLVKVSESADFQKATQLLDDSGYYYESEEITDFIMLPETETDELEKELELLFSLHGVDVRFELNIH